MKGWHLSNSEKCIIGDQKSITSARLFFLWNISKNNILELGADSEEFAWTVFYVDIFLGNLLGFSGIHSRCTCSTLERRYELAERSN